MYIPARPDTARIHDAQAELKARKFLQYFPREDWPLYLSIFSLALSAWATMRDR